MMVPAARQPTVPTGVQRGWLPGARLHLNEGPIDLVIGADGDPAAVRTAFAAASGRFEGLLSELVAELRVLRQPPGSAPLKGPVAQRMLQAVRQHADVFVTPMAAVAGSVADEILAAMATSPGLANAFVNNGGDIAIHLTGGETMRIGAVSEAETAVPDGFVEITTDSGIRGVATSGVDGRSFSRGIADAVTVLTHDAAAADVAATLIANAVDADHPAIHRAPAFSLDPDSDLGNRLVTTEVGRLPQTTVAEALDAGMTCAEDMRRRGLIHAALLRCQDQVRTVANIPSLEQCRS